MRERFSNELSGEVLATFLSEVVAARITFIQINVQTELSAYTVFETLNARGLQLTATDLLKNYLFSLIANSPSDLEQIRTLWARLVAQVSMEDFPVFSYHYLVSLGRDTRKQRLFADMRSVISSREQVFDRIEEMLTAADWYFALSDPQDEIWETHPTARPFVRELALFRVDQFKPLILAARTFIGENKADVAGILRLCAVLSFRATIIGHRNTADVLRAYQAGVAEIVAHGPTSTKAVFEAMQSLYPSDEEFESSFQTVSFRTAGARKKLVKYILSRLEGSFEATEPDFETDPATIEHILPENRSSAWEVDDEDHERFVYRLGNLTLLEPTLNREAANKSFEDKRPIYARSKYAMTRSIEASDWNMETIRARQAELARRALQRWRLDF